MGTKEAQNFLKQLEKLDNLIENKILEREQWKAIATGMTSGGQSVLVEVKGKHELQNMERVQSQSNKQKMADAVIKYIAVEEEINECIDKLIDTKKEVLAVIEQLNAKEYDVIHKIYVQHLDFNEVAANKKRSYSWVTTVHGRALKNVQKILDERKGSVEE